jgi:prepilin-type N-terminal cleavage/methylation domain-containing protein
MRRGFSLAELAVVLAILGVITALVLPRWKELLDWVAVDRAAVEVSTALAVTRSAAVLGSTRARLLIADDSLRIDRWEAGAWQPHTRWVGPAERGVTLEVSNANVVFIPTGLAWGLSNTRVTLRRGVQSAIVTVSRVGRVKRW